MLQLKYSPLLFDLITKVQDVSLSRPPIAKKNTVAQSPTLMVFLVVIFPFPWNFSRIHRPLKCSIAFLTPW